MSLFLMWVNVLGLTGGLLFLAFLVWDAITSANAFWTQHRLRRDLEDVCERFGLTIDRLEIDEKVITGILKQGEIEHGFRVEYTGKYQPLAAESLVRAVGMAAHFDVPEHPEA